MVGTGQAITSRPSSKAPAKDSSKKRRQEGGDGSRQSPPKGMPLRLAFVLLSRGLKFALK